MRPVNLLCAAALVVAAVPARAQDGLERFCLPENDAAFGLDLEVDRLGDMHLSRVRRISGDLVYTRIGPDGGLVDEVAERRISIIGTNEIVDTDLELFDGVPHICAYDAREPGLIVASRGADGVWSSEVVQAGMGAGDFCALVWWQNAPAVAFRHGDVLKVAQRTGEDAWAVVQVDAVEGEQVGVEVDAAVVSGRLVIAHRHVEARRLRVTWSPPNGWQTRSIEFNNFATGMRPKVNALPNGRVAITHGVIGANVRAQDTAGRNYRNLTNDDGLLLTRGRVPQDLPNGLSSESLDGEWVGGSHGIFVRPDGSMVAVARERLRSALFADRDGLRLYLDLPADPEWAHLEFQDDLRQRHTYLRVSTRPDPFGLPVTAFLDETETLPGMPGGAFACAWRPVDTDADRVPDTEERRLGTNPEEADTDGDGRPDGQEILEDSSDPRVDDEPRLDMGVPDAAPPIPDAAPPVPDMAPPTPDMAPPVPDMAPPVPDMAPPTPDMAPPTPDMAPPTPDMAVTPDAAPPAPDMATPARDMAVEADAEQPGPDAEVGRDMAAPAPDMAPVPDMAAAPDMATGPDMGAPPEDMAVPDPDRGVVVIDAEAPPDGALPDGGSGIVDAGELPADARADSAPTGDLGPPGDAQAGDAGWVDDAQLVVDAAAPDVEGPARDGAPTADATAGTTDPGEGCDCRAAGDEPAALGWLLGVGLLSLRRRRRGA